MPYQWLTDYNSAALITHFAGGVWWLSRVLCDKIMGNTISLVQHGSHTARNKNNAMSRSVLGPADCLKAMDMWKSDAQVLRRT